MEAKFDGSGGGEWTRVRKNIDNTDRGGFFSSENTVSPPRGKRTRRETTSTSRLDENCDPKRTYLLSMKKVL